MASPPTGKPFTKGFSGNPGGRCRAAAAIARMIREQTRDGAELVEFALAVLRGRAPAAPAVPGAPQIVNPPDDAKSRMFALQWLSDRGIGKPIQDLDIIVTGSADLSPQQQAMLEALKLSPHERRARVEELRGRALPAPQPADRDDTD